MFAFSRLRSASGANRLQRGVGRILNKMPAAWKNFGAAEIGSVLEIAHYTGDDETDWYLYNSRLRVSFEVM